MQIEESVVEEEVVEVDTDTVVVLFSDTAIEVLVKHIAARFETCVIGKLGDFQTIEHAQDKIMSYKHVIFAHEGMVFDFDVADKMVAKLDSNNVYGCVFSDYVQSVNRLPIPRLRRSYKKSKNAEDNKLIPIFGAVFSEDLTPIVLSELIHATTISTDSFFQTDFDNHVPYHTPDFMFAV
jgi:hypothetical protein